MSVKVSVLGAAGGIGQSLSLLLKTQLGQLLQDAPSGARIHLALYDVAADALNGVAADLSHINTPVKLTHHVPESREDESALKECLRDSNLIVIPAGVPRKPGMTRDDLFGINARIIGSLARAIADVCDMSSTFVLVITNPVNSTVPVMVQELRKSLAASGKSVAGVERRVFGVTQLDRVRASAFVREYVEKKTGSCDNEIPEVPVVGGHSGETIIPVFNEAQKKYGMTEEERQKLVHRVQYGGDEVVIAKKGNGSATLSMAYAAYGIASEFTELLLGKKQQVEDTLFLSLLDENNQVINVEGAEQLYNAIDKVPYFAIPVVVTVDKGVSLIKEKVITDVMDGYERETLLPPCLLCLHKNIEKGQTAAV